MQYTFLLTIEIASFLAMIPPDKILQKMNYQYRKVEWHKKYILKIEPSNENKLFAGTKMDIRWLHLKSNFHFSKKDLQSLFDLLPICDFLPTKVFLMEWPSRNAK